ncbi:4-hydroxythreonine-4-phosphate dehydrogenase 2 [Haloferula helveola]|uniref:4-hydroxythreonine-4-phosphate dehydrogenase 2 n=1 Tax=Haloferula helveola TaxID=490095 RepID=A0ABM7RJM1_9BACT|nr:4-hydroxythreonine-4-phosphate dehydrogenase 2 [Haloferula helveola]
MAGRRRILVTLGDPAGIGPEVIDQALASGQIPEDFEFEVVGESDGAIIGKPDLISARASLTALESAAARLRNDDDVAAVVTGPVSKSQLESAGFRFPGQTEFFAEHANCEGFAMCLSGASLTVGLATIHIPLSEVVGQLRSEMIVQVGRLLADFAKRRKGAPPRIAVAGLNPHAGENGKFGDEEQRIIQPAIEELNGLGIGEFVGPGVPDAIFRDAARGEFDAVVAMYHDQGLIPLKLLDFDNAVNVTLGLPKPRTSPDHGTAFDIAGKGIARPDSMIRAMCVAAELARE